MAERRKEKEKDKQKSQFGQSEQIIRFHSGTWSQSQNNYSTIKKDILSIVLCINKFQYDLLNQNFLI